MSELNLDQLHAFTEVIEHGSFSAAAESIGITQPAVSLRINQLEQRLGVLLLERVGKRVVPTAAGSELLEHAARIEGAVVAAVESLAAYTEGTTGRVRLGTGETACVYLLPPILRDLRRRFPSLELVVHTGNTDRLLQSLEENRIDLGFITMPAPGRAFEVTPVLEDEFVVVAAADDHGLPARITPATLAARPLVLFESGGNTRRLVDQWFAKAGITVKPVMELGSVAAIKELVGAGLGYAVLPRMAIPADDALVAVRTLTPRLHRTIALVIRRDKPRSRGLVAVLEALRAVGS
ncbi:LysR family transcriptional regulator [Nocardia sp. NBC_00565]|uniref:LysR family transcriptional regulator n=1 Tax=Nocardia sp. NBC_00565 TaxID=2975993 RepID=UPI002E8174E1|nr:LysR family transcriptional regulator [Nocardia sp. NBC_00565]WUC06723.1 LysR family transcriptional regulator [Nocardia sp. NBC_00565]